MKNINVKKDVAFILTNIGILCPIVTTGLPIASQIKQNWISYIFVISGTQTIGIFTITYTNTTSADIGICDTSFSVVTVFSSIVSDISTSGTVDSATTGYFSEDSVKAGRAMAILATLSMMTTFILSILLAVIIGAPEMFSSGMKKDYLKGIISFSGFTAMLALIIVRTQFKDGMTISSSFNLAIVADIFSVLTVCFYVISLISFNSWSVRVDPIQKYPLYQDYEKGDLPAEFSSRNFIVGKPPKCSILTASKYTS